MQKLFVYTALCILFVSCKADTFNTNKLELTELGKGNDIDTRGMSLVGFNNSENPVLIHPTNFLYEYDNAKNTLNKMGAAIQKSMKGINFSVAQDAKGDYYLHSGFQGHLFRLNTTTNQWDTVQIEKGYKNTMLTNKNGDIFIHINNTTIGGVETYYIKKANESIWTKIGVKPSNIDQMATPQFLSNDGKVFFNYASSPPSIDGAGIYSEIVLNTATGTFTKLFDYSESANFPVTEGYQYNAFYSDYVNSEGEFYVIVNSTSSAKATLYKLTTKQLPAKFEKVREFNLEQLESGSYLSVRGYKIHEPSGTIRIRLSCMLGNYSHKNIGIAKLSGSSDINILEHDGPQRGLISSPDASVYVLNWDGPMYLWE